MWKNDGGWGREGSSGEGEVVTPPLDPFSSGREGKEWDGKRGVPDSCLCPAPILELEGWDG